MIAFPNIDPVAIALGPISIHWYALTYLSGFAGAWALGRWRLRQPWCEWSRQEFEDFLLYAMWGVILGGRIGYMLFYQSQQLLSDPLSLLQIWQGGMSFHGGFIGVILAAGLFCRKTGKSIWQVTDFAAPLTCVGLFFGRIGNFINGELWGIESKVPWAVVFPGAGPNPRHPSQLYEALLEGLLLFLILWIYSSKQRPIRQVSGLFCIFYVLFRSLVELVRVPDAHLGYLSGGWLTMGQLLSVPMLLFGLYLFFGAKKNPQS